MFKKLFSLLAGVGFTVIVSGCTPSQIYPPNMRAPWQPSGVQRQTTPRAEFNDGWTLNGITGPIQAQSGEQIQPSGPGARMRGYEQRGDWNNYDNCMGGWYSQPNNW